MLDLSDKNTTEEMLLEVIPQGPLSIVGKNTGKYYKCNIRPTNNQIYGMLENLCELHYPIELREILKNDFDIESEPTWEGKRLQSKAYLPILNNNVKIKHVDIPKKFTIFKDLCWMFNTMTSEDGYEKRHINGVHNIDISLFYMNRNEIMSIGTTNEIKSKIPCYYISPKHREYINTNEIYKIKINTTKQFKDLLLFSLKNCDVAYLGNSESIVKINIKC